jgi:hypothetical protein
MLDCMELRTGFYLKRRKLPKPWFFGERARLRFIRPPR